MGSETSVPTAVDDRATLDGANAVLHRSVEGSVTAIASAIESVAVTIDGDGALGIIGAAESGEDKRLVGAAAVVTWTTSHGRSDDDLYETADCGLGRSSRLVRCGDGRERVLAE